MENSEIEENLLSIGDPKLHGDMCKKLSTIYCKVFAIFPDLEAARPRSTTGIQALCNLHMALEKSKNLFQHCAECSKLYLAITGDSVVLKFEKARSVLEDSLNQVRDIVPQAIDCQISEILCELAAIEFSLDPFEKQIGDDIIALLQQGKKFNNCGDNNELESFHQAASRLGITSSRAALRERRALKKVIEKARIDDDKRKESIVAYLSHLMRKYSKLFRSDLSDDNDSQGSTPCSPTVQGSTFEENNNVRAFDKQFSKLSSFNFRPKFRRSEQVAIAPEELRCPISLQLMYDPVIISSGQTYERICIEKWFGDGHNTCPKTQQNLPHLSLTPNYCVKGLVASWCEQNGVPMPDGPPESLDLNYWRLVLSESESTNSKNLKAMDSIGSIKTKGVKIVPIEESCIVEEAEGNEVDDVSLKEEEFEFNVVEKYEEFLMVLSNEYDFTKKLRVVEQIRHLLKDDEEARIYMGANGFVDALIRFLGIAVEERDEVAQENCAMALFNLAVNNNRNKEIMLEAGVVPLLEEMISKSNSYWSTTALYLNLSCLEQAKPIIGSSIAIPFLINVLLTENDSQSRHDSLHALFNLSTNPSNIPHLLSAKIMEGLVSLITDSAPAGDHPWTEKSIAVLINLASSKMARHEMTETPSLISGLCTILEMGEPIEQEQSAACLLILCNGNKKCSQMVLQEGAIPPLVNISMNGTMRGQQKAQKLLMLFREQRQREPMKSDDMDNPKTLTKSTSTRKMRRGLSFWWKSKSFAVYHC